LSPDETVLVLGASGGVASAALQLAKAAGARVFAVTTPEKVERVSAIRPDAVLTYDEFQGRERIMELTDSKGIDVLLQTQGGPTWRAGLEVMGRFGRVVVCSAVQGAEPPEDLGTIWWKQLTIIGSTGGTPHDFGHAMNFVSSGRIRPLVSETFPLSAAAEAQDAFTRHGHVGKVVLEV
jgi:NADPH:quinone reductase-like Zn-dependent oxidoreductase